jgi:hypothetical protein
MAEVNTSGIDDEDRNEREAKGATHFRPERINFQAAEKRLSATHF